MLTITLIEMGCPPVTRWSTRLATSLTTWRGSTAIGHDVCMYVCHSSWHTWQCVMWYSAFCSLQMQKLITLYTATWLFNDLWEHFLWIIFVSFLEDILFSFSQNISFFFSLIYKSSFYVNFYYLPCIKLYPIDFVW